jgi:N-acetylmuramoyl-L-alanine amidase
MPSTEAACRWLCDPASQVSCHYLVDEQGLITQMVAEEMRAWHAGISTWKGESDINSCSIGIEIANPGHEFGYRAFPAPQIASVIDLCRSIISRHPIPPERVLAHSDVAPMRKEDPGELFPWHALQKAGVGHWAPPDPIVAGESWRLGDAGSAVTRLKRRFGKYGYGLSETDAFDEETAAVVRAFQRHFRTELVDGVADVSTLRTLERLSAALRRK